MKFSTLFAFFASTSLALAAPHGKRCSAAGRAGSAGSTGSTGSTGATSTPSLASATSIPALVTPVAMTVNSTVLPIQSSTDPNAIKDAFTQVDTMLATLVTQMSALNGQGLSSSALLAGQTPQLVADEITAFVTIITTTLLLDQPTIAANQATLGPVVTHILGELELVVGIAGVLVSDLVLPLTTTTATVSGFFGGFGGVDPKLNVPMI